MDASKPIFDNANNNEKITHKNKLHKDGDFEKLQENEVLTSPRAQYELLTFIGRGVFGQVFKSKVKKSNKVVAIKILNYRPFFSQQGRKEVSLLAYLIENQADMTNCVRTYDFFMHKSHICIVFEKLDRSLLEFVNQKESSFLRLQYIRLITEQILSALQKLKQLNIIHTDLKMENIMLIDSVRQPYRIKIIDFGSAIRTSEATPNSYIQSRHGRAPEVILGLPFSEAIDMWSLGCLMARMLLGWPLYPGSSEYDQIRFISETQGLPTQQMLDNASKTTNFFYLDITSVPPVWRLKTPEEYETERRIKSEETRKYKLFCLDVIGQLNIPADLKADELLAENADRREFVDILKKMLAIDQQHRITPSEAFIHNFITCAHLSNFTWNNDYEVFREIVTISERVNDQGLASNDIVIDVPQVPLQD